MAKPPLKTASVLAFERKLDASDALFSAGRWDDRANHNHWPAVGVREKSVRGTISNRLKAKEQDPTKLDAKIQNPNLQTVDVATLPANADTLCVRFTLRLLGGVGTPSACNNADYLARLQATVERYAEESGFSELARRYASNLANGRFLWRNRMGAETIEVRIGRISHGQTEQMWTFDAHELSLRDFDQTENRDIQALAAVVESALRGQSHVLLEVLAFARVGDGQEVFPSQELIMDRGGKGGKSKTLYTVDGVAGMHSQKIGNALRTIDTWYPNPDDEPLGPIAIEPYGSVTSQGKAYRQPNKKMDFYSLLDAWVLHEREPAPEQQHFVIANLIRGGVYGESEKE